MGLELKVEQKQRVYQKQIEQARILQMNAQELAVCIQEAALENPLIELEEMMDVPIEELVKKDVRETDEAEVDLIIQRLLLRQLWMRIFWKSGRTWMAS